MRSCCTQQHDSSNIGEKMILVVEAAIAVSALSFLTGYLLWYHKLAQALTSTAAAFCITGATIQLKANADSQTFATFLQKHSSRLKGYDPNFIDQFAGFAGLPWWMYLVAYMFAAVATMGAVSVYMYEWNQRRRETILDKAAIPNIDLTKIARVDVRPEYRMGSRPPSDPRGK